MAGYLGNIPVPQATQTRDRFVATAGQTSFPTSGYTPNYLDVYLNGVKLDSTDYTATNGSDVVLTAGATADDIIEVVAFSTFEIGSNVDNASVATQSLVVDRQSTDGTIIDLQKDGTTVGSIGAASGYITIGQADTGLLFQNTNDRIQPWNVSGNAGRDAGIDLGHAAGRFKDLYLSGGVYLGGTGSANKLEDYEEGTWTPVVSGVTLTSAEGKYTKVGRLVTATFNINSNATTSSSQFLIRNLPFTNSDLVNSGRSAGYLSYDNSSYGHMLLFNNAANYVAFRREGVGTLESISAMSGHLFWGTLIYCTDA
jgi:hypothetical protein